MPQSKRRKGSSPARSGREKPKQSVTKRRGGIGVGRMKPGKSVVRSAYHGTIDPAAAGKLFAAAGAASQRIIEAAQIIETGTRANPSRDPGGWA